MLLALFGYMDIIIIKKWTTDYSGVEHEAPSIISTMVNIFLGGGKVPGREFFKNNVKVHQAILGKLLTLFTLISARSAVCTDHAPDEAYRLIYTTQKA